MGQTLTHGIYLPDEGERNCYNGLAANWNILDGAVGTVAEHTSALAGKAPLVHTHTKSDITDFPAYGNAAGTICEGNDSRLSDARTPVAHTHLTADVTDLLNTAHEWSKSQTYSDGNAIIIKDYGAEIGNEPSAYNEQRIRFDDKNNNYIAAIKYQNQLSAGNAFINGLEFSASDKFKDGVRDPTGTTTTTVLRIGLWNDGTKYIYNEGRWRSNLLPFGNNTNDVGSSSYQWNNLYAKNYYYNGTAWGLDKANTWTGDNTFNGSNSFNSGLTINNAALLNAVLQNAVKGNVSTTGDFAIFIKDKVNGNAATSLLAVYRGGQDSGGSYAQINIDTKGNDNNRYNNSILLRINPADNSNNAVLIPQRDKTIDLGTSTNQWKTFNGINPGALSLPDISDADPIDTQNWVGNNSSSNPYTPTENGWIYFRVEGANKNITIRYGGAGGDAPSITSESTLSHVSVFFPVRSGVTMYIFFNGTMVKAFFYPCLGNV